MRLMNIRRDLEMGYDPRVFCRTVHIVLSVPSLNHNDAFVGYLSLQLCR